LEVADEEATAHPQQLPEMEVRVDPLEHAGRVVGGECRVDVLAPPVQPCGQGGIGRSKQADRVAMPEVSPAPPRIHVPRMDGTRRERRTPEAGERRTQSRDRAAGRFAVRSQARERSLRRAGAEPRRKPLGELLERIARVRDEVLEEPEGVAPTTKLERERATEPWH